MFILAILSVILLGWGVTGFLTRSDSFSQRLGLSFLLGIQLFTLALFLSNFFFGLRLDLVNSWLVMLVLLIAILPFSLCRGSFQLPAFHWPQSGWQKLFLAILILLAGSNLLISFWRPVVDWDAVTMFDYRAKIILDTGWIKDTLFRATIFSYPLLTTLSHYWLEVNGAPTAMPLYPLFYISFILVSYSLLKRSLPQSWVLPGLLLLTTAPKMFDQSLIAYANLPYTIYLILGAAYLYFWSREQQKPDLVLGVSLSLFSFWVRSFPFALGSLLAVILLHPKTRKATLIILTAVGFFVLIRFFNLSKLTGAIAFFKWAILDYYFPYTWLFILLAIWQLLFKRQNLYWLLTITFYLLLFLAGTYFYADINPEFAKIPDAAQRMTMFINPAIIWFSLTVLYETFSKSKSSV
jgi:hypothetical protein